MPAANHWQAQIEAKQKLLEPVVRRAIDRVRSAVLSRSPKITDSLYYGAIGINPKHLVIWYIFKTTADKKEAEANGFAQELEPMSRDALRV